nr:hypothetical protein CcurKRNrm3_p035 [Cryptomonas curvata]
MKNKIKSVKHNQFNNLKVWKKYYYAIKISKILKNILKLSKREISDKNLKNNLFFIYLNNLLVGRTKFSIFEYIFILCQEKNFTSFFFLNLYGYVKIDYRKKIEKEQLLRNNINILYEIFLNKNTIFCFVNEIKKKFKLLFFLNRYKIMFSTNIILNLDKKGLIINFISNLYPPLYLVLIIKKYQIFLCKK